MADWSAALDKFLRDTKLPVLSGAGAMSHHEEALDAAEGQYTAFAERRRLEAKAMGRSATAMTSPPHRSSWRVNVIWRSRAASGREMRDALPGPGPSSARLRLRRPVPRSAPA